LNLLLGLLVIIDVTDSLVCRALVRDLGVLLLHLAQNVVHAALDVFDLVLHLHVLPVVLGGLGEVVSLWELVTVSGRNYLLAF